MKPSNVWHGHSTRPSLPAGTARKGNGHLSGRGPSICCCKTVRSLQSPTGAFIAALRKHEFALAGRTGSSYPRQKKKTERSRRGTPCCTYRYRLWSFAGCVLFGGVPCFFTMLHHFPRATSGIRHQHESGSNAAHPGIVPIFCAGMPCKLARMQCHFPAYCPILSA